MQRRAILGLLLGLMLVVGAGQASAGWIIYTDQDLWNSAVAARSWGWSFRETFDDGIYEPWLTIMSFQPGGVVAFQWQSVVSSWGLERKDWFFHGWTNTFAWGATFNLADPGGPGEGIDVYADLGGWDHLIGSLPGTYRGFWGFVVDGYDYRFRYTRLEGGGDPLGTYQRYWMDDLSIGVQLIPLNQHPAEPASLVLLATGLLALARRRKQ